MSAPTPRSVVRKPREATVAVIAGSIALVVIGVFYILDTGTRNGLLYTALGVAATGAITGVCWYRSRKAEAVEHRLVLERQEELIRVQDRLAGEVADIRKEVAELARSLKEFREGVGSDHGGLMKALGFLNARLEVLDAGTEDGVDWQGRAEAFCASMAAPPAQNVHYLHRGQ